MGRGRERGGGRRERGRERERENEREKQRNSDPESQRARDQGRTQVLSTFSERLPFRLAALWLLRARNWAGVTVCADLILQTVLSCLCKPSRSDPTDVCADVHCYKNLPQWNTPAPRLRHLQPSRYAVWFQTMWQFLCASQLQQLILCLIPRASQKCTQGCGL